MRVLLVHPSPLMYSEVYLKLEPLGLERVAQALRAAGHEVRLLDLQIFSHKDYVRELDTFKPRAVGFSLNYLANEKPTARGLKRSEEHTSELQSRLHLVCRLLLEKKNK